ncbi:uncharacterized protein B0I36DRAFT_355271 [Microdochium trichocladiopsis]|uniref:Uncharacterized protein n=1 Tax=Microdochium trichocladiopsis TaxID=1682393 RepID=A0A9P8XV21_9PEZI|nr:uncharacterized protein B0I36DRAFT_355271 [Microdochium trichocladiopsis]KAH7016484.1 hypothetical protein B0I36DRAFT_355271 [Microdochium trichocladiopsis]
MSFKAEPLEKDEAFFDDAQSGVVTITGNGQRVYWLGVRSIQIYPSTDESAVYICRDIDGQAELEFQEEISRGFGMRWYHQDDALRLWGSEVTIRSELLASPYSGGNRVSERYR